MLRTPIFIVALLALSCVFLLGSDKVAAQGTGIQGGVYGKDYMGQYHQIGWANITVKGGNISVSPQAVFNAGGGYYVFVPPGSYMVTASVPGYKTQSVPVSVTWGSSTSVNFYLEQSGVPIPEFHEYATPLIASLSALLVMGLLRKRIALQKGIR
jgi:hypothetical protein